MKKFWSFVLILLCAAIGITAWYYFRTPFDTRFDHAISLCEQADYDAALPVMKKAVNVYDGTPRFPQAIYWLARCETSVNSTNVARWNAVMNSTTSQSVLAEARYNLARVHPERATAMQAYIRDYPERAESRAFLLELGATALRNNDIVQAQAVWQLLVDYHPDAPETAEIIDQLGRLNLKLLCSFRPQPFKIDHEVLAGDYLSTIARKYNSFVESIKRINGLKSDNIRPGVRLKVDTSRYLVDVDISDHILTLYRVWNGSTNFVKRYSVGTGKNDNTPRGTFKIDLKQPEPTWFKTGNKAIPYGDKENLLGTRWLGIDCPGYGIHGTWEPDTVGKSSSAGCIRMNNEDVEELFDIVPMKTPVNIHD